MRAYCPECGVVVKHVTDDIFRCLSCRWSGANVVENPRERDDDDGVQYADPRDERAERLR